MSSLGVNIAIINDGNILLTLREDFEVWCLPGGEVEHGESVAQAAIREAFEETGLVVALTCLVGIYSRPRSLKSGTHIVLFAAQVVGGDLHPQVGEVLELRYFHPREIPEDLLLGQRQRIQDALNGIRGVSWLQDSGWPFPPDMTRQEIYSLRDRSGLPRKEYYRRSLDQSTPGTDILEVGER